MHSSRKSYKQFAETMIQFDVSIKINRSLEQVFAFAADENNLARWNSAVQSVRQKSLPKSLPAPGLSSIPKGSS
jgi:hypothetical protein